MEKIKRVHSKLVFIIFTIPTIMCVEPRQNKPNPMRNNVLIVQASTFFKFHY